MIIYKKIMLFENFEQDLHNLFLKRMFEIFAHHITNEFHYLCYLPYHIDNLKQSFVLFCSFCFV
jgi:hypothetical protein